MTARLRLEVSGLVQGVGFRPYVYRLAGELALSGWVRNDAAGVHIEVEGDKAPLDQFRERLSREAPPLASVQDVTSTWLPTQGSERFEIRESEGSGERTVPVLADVAPCAACLAEMRDPADRRYRYPFVNCTHCGPRASIVRALPYDRPHTTMAGFALCPDCRAEYENPADRRFHAQPVACPACGPRLAYWMPDGTELADGEDALDLCVQALQGGQIVGLKGVGGFQLLVDARDARAVARLRARKRREEKPFALMLGTLEQVRQVVDTTPEAEQALCGPEAPIVLLSRRAGSGIADNVAPRNPRLGVMLPASPLHHLLMREISFPLVATSGNLTDEPICTDEKEALTRLHGIADGLLVHDRPIARHLDDSVGMVAAGAFRITRRARGFAPLPVLLAEPVPPILAVGAHLKSAVALSVGRRVLVGPHVGDLDTPEALVAFERACEDMVRLYGVTPEAVAHDLHPDYASTQWAQATGAPLVAVQHHHAHLASCLAENGVSGEALGVIWDGTGLGTDGTIWGGEFLLGSASGYRRVAHLKPFRLPGGDAAAREPRRSALALLHAVSGAWGLAAHDLPPLQGLSRQQLRLLAAMLAKGTQAPLTTSAGRLFDGVAALLGLRMRSAYEGQAAMEVESAAGSLPAGGYPMPLVSGPEGTVGVLDWSLAVEALVRDVRRGTGTAEMAARFHEGLANGILQVARVVGVGQVALSGGCFQNKRLLEGTAARLTSAGFTVFLHRRVPPGDGGVALGQVAVAAARLAGRRGGA
ncbi:MAG TPA: carbamoyltransferase HypF [Candidatus Polarisedimenticolaceae bacterium]|nr:carbamoyltransferase HypF [Candidatus Polarisedimenticolaceae bacterium]